MLVDHDGIAQQRSERQALVDGRRAHRIEHELGDFAGRTVGVDARQSHVTPRLQRAMSVCQQFRPIAVDAFIHRRSRGTVEHLRAGERELDPRQVAHQGRRWRQADQPLSG